MSIKGPYVDGAWYNKPGETVYFCIDCANERELHPENAIMYDELPGIDYLECDDCGETIRATDMSNTMTWRELVQEALSETKFAYKEREMTEDAFLETFETFYDELHAENRITMYPLDPPSSKRKAMQRATAVYADGVA